MSIDDEAGELVASAITRLEEEDFVRAYQEVPGLRRLLWQPVMALGVVTLGGGVAYAALFEPSGMLGIVVCVWLAILAWIAFTRRRIPQKQWRATPEHARQVRIEVRQHRFRTRTERNAVDIVYEDFYGSLETEHAFYLEQQGNYFVIIPKSAFASPEAIRAASEHFKRSIVRRKQKYALDNPLKTLILWALLIALMSGLYALLKR